MTRIFVEAQYDSATQELRLRADTGFGTQPYTITAIVEDGGKKAYADFVNMYRRNGATVVALGANGQTLVLEPLSGSL